MATIKDVAKKAGVSITLVSRYINARKGVGAESAKRIAAAIEELGYQPNTLARSLVQGRTRTVAVLMDTLCSESYFPFIEGIEEGLAESEYSAVFLSGSTVALKQRYFDEFSVGRVDGMIVSGALPVESSQHSAKGRALTLVDNRIPGLEADIVYFDNRQGAYLLTRHMLRTRQWVCHFSGGERTLAAFEREQGYRQAMVESQGEDHVHIVECGLDKKDGFDTMKRLLGKDLCPEAVLCSTDEVAFGVMQALLEHGKRVPEHVFLAGFGGSSDPLDPRYPTLTTVALPMHEMGRDAAQLLLARIANPELPMQVREHMPRLLLKRSTRN
ncbi:MAG: LacI family transcriptional regulator [Clostridiales bacterium]|nr:LacI family transcriptional regulator [Clostridiales bacterium]